MIGKLLEQHGCKVYFKSYVGLFEVLQKSYDAYIWMPVMNPTWLTDTIPVYLEARQATHGRAYIYCTVEGIPYPLLCRNLPVKYGEYIANSHFTRQCLEEAGLRVIDVIHHAIDMDRCRRAERLGSQLRQKIKRDFKNRVVFCYVGRDDHRKQLDRLMQAVDILNEKARDKFVLLLHTELRRPKLFERPNVYIVSEFGKLSHEQVLAFMHACDYMVFPSVCEGFGVPVLESMAVGRPVVHCWFPPLSEFSHREANIVFDYTDIEYWKVVEVRGAEQYFKMHMYDPQDLADAMLQAIDIYVNYPSEYEDRCTKVKEHASKWDYRRVYTKWLQLLRITEHNSEKST